jgi:hypothetical protein
MALAVVAVTLGACSSGNPVIPAILRGPRAVVAFNGKSPDSGGLVVPLLAIAATRGNELRIIDPLGDTPLAAPNIAYPLGVPTMQVPIHLAVASMGDQQPDVLLVGSGGSVIQLYGSWLDGDTPPEAGFGIVWTKDLAGWNLGPLLGAGVQIASMTGGAVPSGAPVGNPPVAPAAVGQARVFVGLTGGDDGKKGRLLVLDFARGDNGVVQLLTDPADPTTSLPLGFGPVGLSFSPDNTHLYVASRDVVLGSDGSQVLGIAEIDTSQGPPSTWTVRALDGLAPTTAVSAVILGERTAANPKTFGPPVLRVYASVDPSGCGRQAPIACGIATYDPARQDLGLARDPSPGPSPKGAQVPAQSYQTPIFVPADPFALATALPPASGTQRCVQPASCDGFDGGASPLMALAPQSGIIWTTAAGAVAGASGSVFVLDLGRWSIPDETDMLAQTGFQTRVASASSTLPSDVTGNQIGLYQTPGFDPPPPAPPTPPSVPIVITPGALPSAFIVWPGFTTDDLWSLSWQGLLPGLWNRNGSLGRLPTGELYLAVQQPVNASGPPPSSASDWLVGAFVDDAELGIHAAADWIVGDRAVFTPTVNPAIPCPGHPNPVTSTDTMAPWETSIEAILPQRTDESFPGGAMVLDSSAADVACLANQIPLGTSVSVILSVRASALVLVGLGTGYAGRPQFDRRFDLAWQPEADLTDEALILARKARRFYYPGGPYAGATNGGPCADGQACYPGFPEMTDPMQSGPLVAFRPGLVCAGTCPPGATPPRDAAVTFTTASGFTPVARRITGVAAGTWITSFDKSVFPVDEALGRVFYTTFIGDAMMMLPPGQPAASSTVIR